MREWRDRRRRRKENKGHQVYKIRERVEKSVHYQKCTLPAVNRVLCCEVKERLPVALPDGHTTFLSTHYPGTLSLHVAGSLPTPSKHTTLLPRHHTAARPNLILFRNLLQPLVWHNKPHTRSLPLVVHTIYYLYSIMYNIPKVHSLSKAGRKVLKAGWCTTKPVTKSTPTEVFQLYYLLRKASTSYVQHRKYLIITGNTLYIINLEDHLNFITTYVAVLYWKLA